MSAPVLSVAGLRAGYGAAQVLGGVDFAIGSGEVVALMGRNGAGKTTTLKAVMGMIPRQGNVLFHGKELARLAPYQVARRGIGYVPEERRIFTDLTVRENLDIGRRSSEGSRATAWDEAKVFALFPQLAAMAERSGGQMSGGEQQMLTIARTLMGNPQLLLLDEPSEGIAPVVIEQIAAALLQMKTAGVSMLLAEQNLPFAALVADRAIVLEQGRVAWSGTFAALMADAALLRRHLTL